jgi:hypothetical protein
VCSFEQTAVKDPAKISVAHHAHAHLSPPLNATRVHYGRFAACGCSGILIVLG